MNGNPRQNPQKLRVAAYCRVSTEMEAQESSMEWQQSYYKNQIEATPQFTLAGIYGDKGASGRSIAGRKQFQQMLRDCEAGEIDVILTKSISRFARSLPDCVQTIRRLQAMGISVRFEKENIDTGTVFSEMLLTILAAFAQEESRSLSENAKWGIRKRFEAGQPSRHAVFGYRFSGDTDYVAEPDEADTVRRIFHLYETGRWSMAAIASTLMAEGRRSTYGDKWDASHVHVILCNEMYIGDVLMQKKYTVDHMTHKEKKNRDRALPQYYARNHHEAIVERKQFERCQTIMKLKSTHDGAVQYPYGDMVVCPVCGEPMKQLRVQKRQASLVCGHAPQGGASGRYAVKRETLDKAVLDAYARTKLKTIAELAENGEEAQREYAQAFLRVKRKHLALTRVDYWWLDELAERITLEGDEATVHWRCGLKTASRLVGVRRGNDERRTAGKMK